LAEPQENWRSKVYGQQIDVSVQHTQISVLAALALVEQGVIGSIWTRVRADWCTNHHL